MLCHSLLYYRYDSGMYAILYMQKWVGNRLNKFIDLVRHPHSSSYSYVTNMNRSYFFLTITILSVCKWSPIKSVLQHISFPLITLTYSHNVIKSQPQHNGPSLLCIIQWFTSHTFVVMKKNKNTQWYLQLTS